MDMNSIKAIFDNNTQKNVKKITDGNGNILWYKVPDGYRKVDWLGTDGYAYVDTRVKPTTRDKHEAVFDCVLRNSTGQVLFGSVLGLYNDNPNNWMLFRPHQSASVNRVNLWYRFIGYSSGVYTIDNLFVPGTKQHLLIEQTSNTVVKYKLNNSSLYSLTTRNAEIEVEQPNYRLLRYQVTDESKQLDNTMKIYSYRLSQNGVCVRQFIPVLRNSDSKPGMYDLVNDVFYTNAGSGEFTYGGGVIDNNLFLGFDSPWCCSFSCAIQSGQMASADDSRTTYFFECKPNTTYRYTATTGGDRFCIFALKQLYDNPPEFAANTYPYSVSSGNIRIIENSNTPQINSTTNYTFTTDSEDKMVYIYFALNTRPTGVRIVEVES